MTAVFVHGVPDTHHIWDGVLSNLELKDAVALALPGFGAPVPDEFTATKEEYVDWIVARLEEFDAPVDLVGHDWGCIWSARVASLRPDLVRTLAVGSGPVSPDYEWHPWATVWQTPDLGEQWMADLNPEGFSAQLQEFGVPAELAAETVGRMDDTLKDSILRIYRSAVNVGAEWEPELSNVTSPTLVFWGSSDPACPVEFADRLGDAVKNSHVLKLDAGHWTPLERPSEIATALTRHWNRT